ncbi:MAG TPA: molecular chaperone DnaJ [Thermoanaerobaculia bacterium]|jgi:hypothetical protein|nr:molecular chaperone DnaJ [Thermoanaerobaculia bacterium]
MCNPRKITVTATRELAEAWQREVSRTAALSAEVLGEARVSQHVDESLGGPALQALEAALGGGDSGWREVEDGYRLDVEGGYAVYHVDERTLEIVAVRQEVVEATGEARAVLQGEVRDSLSAERQAGYYEDGYAGRTRERAEAEANQAAQRGLDAAARERIEQAGTAAEAAADSELRARAEAAARTRLEQAAAAQREELDRQAATHLAAVGLRCRQAFHALLARAYRDAILAYARRHGAEGVQCQENGDVLEIEFQLQS